MADNRLFKQVTEPNKPIVHGPISSDSARIMLRGLAEESSLEKAPFAWMVREGDVPGKLVVQYNGLVEVRSEIKWVSGSLDLIHTEAGWKLLPIGQTSTEKITTDGIDKDEASFSRELKKLATLNIPSPELHLLNEEYLIKPQSNNQSKKYLYTGKMPEVHPSLRCAGTGEPLEDPVTVVVPRTPNEKIGETYERTYLEKKGYNEGYNSVTKKYQGNFIPNIALKGIIDNIKAGKPTEVQAIIQDPILTDPMKNAVLSPSGHSFSQQSIEEWLKTNKTDPITRSPITAKELVPNLALRSFITQSQQVIAEPSTQVKKKH